MKNRKNTEDLIEELDSWDKTSYQIEPFEDYVDELKKKEQNR